MKVSKLKQILFDSSMQNRDLTTELKPLNHSGNNHNGRKVGSKNKMTLVKLSVTVNSLGKTVGDLAKTVNDLTTFVQDLAIEMRKGFKQINTRIDNLVSKNNLKE